MSGFARGPKMCQFKKQIHNLTLFTKHRFTQILLQYVCSCVYCPSQSRISLTLPIVHKHSCIHLTTAVSSETASNDLTDRGLFQCGTDPEELLVGLLMHKIKKQVSLYCLELYGAVHFFLNIETEGLHRRPKISRQETCRPIK